MTELTREQLGWKILKDVWQDFRATVEETWGEVSPYVNRELEDAIREFLDQDPYAQLEHHLQDNATDPEHPGPSIDEDKYHPVGDVDTAAKTTVWVAVHPGLKEDLAAVAEDNDRQKWTVLTAAVQAYSAGGRAQRLQTKLTDDTVADPTAAKQQDTAHSAAPEATTQATSEKTSPLSEVDRPEMVFADGMNYLRQGTSEQPDVYDSPTPDLDAGSETRGEDSSGAIVGFERYLDTQINEVIEQLAGDCEPPPPAFSERELYQTAAAIGISVWNQSRKDEVTDRVLERLDYEWDPESRRYVPAIGERLVESITTCADTVAATLDEDLEPAVQAEFDELVATHGYDDLPDSVDERPATLAARQAVLALLLKATLYEHYHRRGDLPPLPDDIQAGFEMAAEQTDNPAFEISVLDDVLWAVEDEVLAPVVAGRHRLVQSVEPAEDIGHLQQAVLPSASRYQLGQHRTPLDIGDVMQSWATTGGDVVLDPGMGSGMLSTPRYPRWDTGTEPAHVAGVDRSDLAVVMGATALTLTRQSHKPWATDFFDLSPEELSDDPDTIVCNAPYTPYRALPDEYRTELREQLEAETGREIPGKTPLYAYFIYHARQFLTDGDRAVFVTPQAFLWSEYGRSLKAFLCEEFDVEAMVAFDPDADPVFHDADTTAVVTFLEVADERDESANTRFIRVDGTPDTTTLRRAVRDGQPGETEWGSIIHVRQGDLEPAQNWRRKFASVNIDTDHLIQLSEIADISKGIMTGENDFFCLSEQDVETWGIDEQHLSRLVPTPSNVQGYAVTDETLERCQKAGHAVWLLYNVNEVAGVPETLTVAPDDPTEWTLSSAADGRQDDDSSGGLVAYLRDGLTNHETLSTRATVRNRACWYRVDRKEPASLLIPYRCREFRVLLNETDARTTNSYHCIYPDVTVDEQERKALLAYLNSAYFVTEILPWLKKPLSEGRIKLEPGDVKKLPVPDPRELPDTIIEELAARFDALRTTTRTADDHDDIQEQIDRILEDVLKTEQA